MRKIDILNKNYEVANLNTVVYEGYSIKEIIEDSPVFDVTPPQHYLDYWKKIYDYLKDGTQLPGHTYIPSGQSKYDIAYINKTIDDPITELNGHTLREVFEEGNLAVLNLMEAYGFDNRIVIANDEISMDVSLLSESSTFRYQNISQQTISDFYYSIEIKPKFQNGINISVFRNDNIQHAILKTITPTANVYNKISVLYNWSVLPDDFNPRFRHPTNINYALDDKVYLKNMMVIDRKYFGIEALTLEKMDYYNNLYQLRKKISKKILTYADIFEAYEKIVNKTFDSQDWWFFTAEDASGYAKVENGRAHIVSLDNSNKYIVSPSIFTIGERYYARLDYDVLVGSLATENLYFPNLTGKGTYSYIQTATPGSTWVLKIFGISDIYIDNTSVIPMKYFDELMTKEQLDLLLAHYLIVKDIVIYPENFIPLEPIGFGNRYKFKELNTKIYGHEMDFEKMQLNLLFGTYRNAYESFNLLMNFMINNEAIISYDYGKGIRYTDVRLIAAPKTELDNGQHMRSKFDFKRLSPFYTIEEGSTLTIKNVHDWDIKPIVSGTVNTNIVYIEAEDTTTTVTLAVKFDFTSLTKPFNFYYNAETKQILINGINNGYQYIDFSYGVSFISLPKDTEHLITTTGITSPVVKAKKWVID